MTLRLAVAVPLLVATSAFAQTPDPGSQDARGPEGQTVGIGLGWQFPTPLLEPNIASARFRLGAVTLEPSIRLAFDRAGTESETVGRVADAEPVTVEDEARTRGTGLEVGGTVRYPFARRGNLSLVGLGGVNVGWSSAAQDEDLRDETTVDEARSSALNASLNWGLGIEWFMRHNLALSADARNPLVSWSRTTTTTREERDTPVGRATGNSERVTTALSGGLTFRPQIRVMLHLYF